MNPNFKEQLDKIFLALTKHENAVILLKAEILMAQEELCQHEIENNVCRICRKEFDIPRIEKEEK